MAALSLMSAEMMKYTIAEDDPVHERGREAAPEACAGPGGAAPAGGLVRRLGHQLNPFLDPQESERAILTRRRIRVPSFAATRSVRKSLRVEPFPRARDLRPQPRRERPRELGARAGLDLVPALEEAADGGDLLGRDRARVPRGRLGGRGAPPRCARTAFAAGRARRACPPRGRRAAGSCASRGSTSLRSRRRTAGSRSSRRMLRIALVRKPTGSPPERTTRRPFRRFPGVRPDASTSKRMS